MNRLDPYLAHLTGKSHFGLLAIGTFLMISVGIMLLIFALVLPFPRFSQVSQIATGDVFILGSALACLTGVLAWVALGLLLFKRSDPFWHLACWPVVGLFGIITVPYAVLWLMQAPVAFLFPVFAGGIGSLYFSVQNVQRAWTSLKRSRSLQGLVSSNSLDSGSTSD